MKCLRCQNQMATVSEVSTNTFNCFTAGCPVMELATNMNGDFQLTLNFEKYPTIRVQTGYLNGAPFTKIIEDFLDDPMAFTGTRTIAEFDKEMKNITLDRLQTILTFR